MSEPTPYRIEIPEQQLEDLKRRLAATRWPDAETPDDWSQGIPLAYMRELCAYWAEKYDWRRCEAQLNAIPQFLVEIDGLDVHFLHIRSPHPEARPLVITHGWPGSVTEFMKVIGPLTDPPAHGGVASDAFHVVCPTLPGFGFSGKPTRTGWTIERIGRAWGALMARLGYDAYFAQGGDWGAAATFSIGNTEREHCAGIHTNMALVHPRIEQTRNITDFERAALGSLQYYVDWDSGYSKQQQTRPQTLGYGLVDSPAGQAAWVVEKFWSWTDCQGHPENVCTRDELLDNVMMYWLPGTGASSARIYWESFSIFSADSPQIHIPVGISVFPKEIFRASRRWAEQRFTQLVHFNIMDKGGHFPSLELPEVYLDEVRTCFRKMR